MPAKRSNPGTIRQAVKLSKGATPAEKKLCSYLHGDQLNGVSFRRQHTTGEYITDFVSIKKKLASNWMAVITLNRRKKNMMLSELSIWNLLAIRCFVF